MDFDSVMQQGLSRRSILLSALALTLAPNLMAAPTGNYSRRKDVRKWARAMAAKEKLSYKWVMTHLGKAKYISESVRIMDKPRLTAGSTPDDWNAHRRRFINAVRLDKGLEFVRRHRTLLLKIQAQYHVPAAVLVAILGVETIFGQRQGNYRVLDTLTTLSFDHKRRAEFFRKELAAFLKMCRKNRLDPTSVMGSFAGAVGMCQFMPSNIPLYGVDYDKNGKIDLNRSFSDGLASVANYMAKHGWRKDQAIAWECEANESIAEKLKAGGSKPHTTLNKARLAGVRLLQTPVATSDTPVMLIDLKSPEDTKWRLGTENFAVIMRYNRSYFYAETVRELTMALIAADPALAGDMQLAASDPLDEKNAWTTEGQTLEIEERISVPQTEAPKTPAASNTGEATSTSFRETHTQRTNRIRESQTIIEPRLPEPPQSAAPAVVLPAGSEPAVFAIPDMDAQLMPDGVPPAGKVHDWSKIPVTPAVNPALFD